MSDKSFNESALAYHRQHPPGKLSIVATKPLTTQRELALAYSPGVAAACEEIVRDPQEASTLTARSNLVAVITNGTAVLGLGNIGPLAAKPVMEGKSVLFKKFAGIDSIDLEVAENDVDKLVDTIAALEPSFGGINLEDIKAPQCFEVETRLRERMKIPVFHDDQHGTAIIVAAALKNWLRLTNRDIAEVKLAASGAGAAAIACLNLLVSMGMKKDNITVCDRKGVIHHGRNDLDPFKQLYVRNTDLRTLKDAMKSADVFLGLSVAGAVTPDMVTDMAEAPLILGLANPVPEILPEEAKAVRPDAIIATGRSDYPNQVNNVLCFPFIFRGALDVGATTINEAMKLACVDALADLAMEEAHEIVAAAYSGQPMCFGTDYLIPKPFDPRLIIRVAAATAKAAMDSGVAERPITDFEAYKQKLSQFVFRTGLTMEPVFKKAKADPKRVVFAEGEEERVLHAVQVLVDEKMVKPILIGRPDVMQRRIERHGLRIRAGQDFELINPYDDPRYNDYVRTFYDLNCRNGITLTLAKTIVRTVTTAIGALMIHKGDADAMICGTVGRYHYHLNYVKDVIPLQEGVKSPHSLSLVVMDKGKFFIGDAYVDPDPSAEQICEMTLMAAEKVQNFGMTPKVALLSHSFFGSHTNPSAMKMKEALAMIRERAPDLMVDGEMTADAALSQDIRDTVFPESNLEGAANLLITPDIDSANIGMNLARITGNAITVGPLLLGLTKPVHIMVPSIGARGIVNASAIACVDAQNTPGADRIEREISQYVKMLPK